METQATNAQIVEHLKTLLTVVSKLQNDLNELRDDVAQVSSDIQTAGGARWAAPQKD